MPSPDTKILEFNQYWISDQISSIIHANCESLIKRIGGCKNNFELSSTTKVCEQVPCGYSMSTIWMLHGIESNYGFTDK